MSAPDKKVVAGTVTQVQDKGVQGYTSQSEAAADGPEAEAAYLKSLQDWVKDKDYVYQGQAGTIGFADFRPTVGLARSELYWDNMTGDAETKRIREENKFDAFVDENKKQHGAPTMTGEDSEQKPRRESKIKETLGKVFHHSSSSDGGGKTQ